jgi:adenylate cyclase
MARSTGTDARPTPPGKQSAQSSGAASGPEQRLHRAELLLGISRKLAAIDSLDEILAALIEITSSELDAERGSLFLNDSQSGELYSIVASGNLKRRIRILNTSGIAGHVFQSGKGIIVPDAYKDSRFNRSVDAQTGYITRDMICTPIKTVKGEIIGIAQVLNKKTGKFSRDDLQLLEAMTMQAAIALQGAQFIEKMQQSRKQELEFLDIVSDITSEIELGSLLQKVMCEATKMLQADRSTLFLNNEKSNELWSLVGSDPFSEPPGHCRHGLYQRHIGQYPVRLCRSPV